MARYALIVDGRAVQIFEDTPPKLHPSLQIVPCGADTQPGYIVDAQGNLSPDPTKAQWKQATVQAMALLTDSDEMIIRCTEANVPIPNEWKIYRQALRTIVVLESDPGTPVVIPPTPPKPAGIPSGSDTG
jgi:hypothetical protein